MNRKRKQLRQQLGNSKPIQIGDPHGKVRVNVTHPDGTVTEELWTNEQVSNVVGPTEFLHDELTPEQSAIARYTYKRAGRFVYSTYEQWERGFLVERSLDDELAYWLRIVVFLEHVKPSDDVAKSILDNWISGTLTKAMSDEITKVVESTDLSAFMRRVFAESKERK